MPSIRTHLTAEFVRSILDYSPDTGLFRWRYRPDCPQKWNTRYAGRPAGTIKGGTNGYIWIQVSGRVAYAAHRLAWLYMTGEWPKEMLDHIDGDRTNSRFANLREATHSQNNCHKRIQSNNTSGFPGVNFNVQNGKWEARITVNKVLVYRGFFKTPEEANAARQIALPLAHGEFSTKNPKRPRYAHNRDKAKNCF